MYFFQNLFALIYAISIIYCNLCNFKYLPGLFKVYPNLLSSCYSTLAPKLLISPIASSPFLVLIRNLILYGGRGISVLVLYVFFLS